jgi:hypothetical protein
VSRGRLRIARFVSAPPAPRHGTRRRRGRPVAAMNTKIAQAIGAARTVILHTDPAAGDQIVPASDWPDPDMDGASTARCVCGSSTTRHDGRPRARRGDRCESCIAALAGRRAELTRDLGGRHVLPGCRGVSPCPAPLLSRFNGDDPPTDIYEQRVPRSRTGPAFEFCDECPKPQEPLTLHHQEGPSPPPRTPLSESFPTSRNANTVAADHQGPEVRLTGQRSCAHHRAAIARPGRSRHTPTLALRAPSS